MRLEDIPVAHEVKLHVHFSGWQIKQVGKLQQQECEKRKVKNDFPTTTSL